MNRQFFYLLVLTWLIVSAVLLKRKKKHKGKGFPRNTLKICAPFCTLRKRNKQGYLPYRFDNNIWNKWATKQTNKQSRTPHIGLDGRIWPTKKLIEMWCWTVFICVCYCSKLYDIHSSWSSVFIGNFLNKFISWSQGDVMYL